MSRENEFRSSGTGSNKTAYKSKSEFNNDYSSLESKHADTKFNLTTVQDAQYSLDKVDKNIGNLMNDADNAIGDDGVIVNNTSREKAINDTINIKNNLENIQHKLPSYNKLTPQEKSKVRQNISGEIDKDTLIQSKLQVHNTNDIKIDNPKTGSTYVKAGKLTPLGYAIVTDPSRLAELPEDTQAMLIAAYKNDPERKAQQVKAGLVVLDENDDKDYMKTSPYIIAISKGPGED